MASIVFNIAKGAAAEKARDDATKFGILLLKVAEADAAMKDRATVATVVANSTECDFTNYARKTGLTGTLVVDNAGDVVTIAIPSQTWTAAGGGANNNIVKLVVFYEEAAADATRVPVVAADFVVTTDGSDLTAQAPAAAFTAT